ncbi:hypothetical protein [Pantoea cypripedii]|uniref:SH3 domain-containing protein n=1 Tax=Pantoea cypripedii TaxID=55209 RepID=A0A1X1EWD1_PANCY|nr:hypothetical protein [Pantoea cypripedii]MBP2198265.1 hypothetical protein [Pantoea cypripedii]ORM94085.1 hypothetical protein HA50_12265 [Pantoea cypripedii]
MIKFFGLLLVLLPLTSSASVSCQEADKTGISQGARFDNTDNLYKVGGQGRLQFYSAPDAKCIMKGTFVIPGNDLIAYVEYGGFYRVMYVADDDQVTGWVKKNRLIETHKGIAPNYDE